METPKIANVSNITAFGAEWIGETGSRYQLVNVRGTTGLTLGFKSSGSQSWSSTTVVAAERFGLTTPPKSYREFVKIVQAYISPS